MNKHRFTVSEAINLIKHISQASVDVIEVGYFRRHSVFDGIGLTAHCPPEYLSALPKGSSAKYVVMLRPGDISSSYLEELSMYDIWGVRIPVTVWNMAQSLKLASAAKALGLKVSINIIRVSELNVVPLITLVQQLNQEDIDVLYVADSNGAMLPSDFMQVVQQLSEVVDKPIGCHAHDHLRLAIANSLASIQAGATWIDGTVTGVGKGAGNAATEVLLLILEKLESRHVFLAPLIKMLLTSNTALFAGRTLDAFEYAIYGRNNFNVEDIQAWKLSQQTPLNKPRNESLESLKQLQSIALS